MHAHTLARHTTPNEAKPNCVLCVRANEDQTRVKLWTATNLVVISLKRGVNQLDSLNQMLNMEVFPNLAEEEQRCTMVRKLAPPPLVS